MVVPNSCFGFFIDVREKISCSAGYLHHVVRKSFLAPINVTTVIAGNGMAGSPLNQLDVPQGLFMDFDLNLSVADCNNNGVLRFARNHLHGTVVAGSTAPSPIELHCPAGIALDADGYLFISDFAFGRVVGSGPNGCRCVVGCSDFNGSAANQLSRPYGFTFDRYANLVVADRDNHRIQKLLLARNTCSEYDIAQV